MVQSLYPTIHIIVIMVNEKKETIPQISEYYHKSSTIAFSLSGGIKWAKCYFVNTCLNVAGSFEQTIQS